MSKSPNYTLIGAFVAAGIALAVGGVAAIGGGKFLQRTYRYVLYFQGSVKGLTVGAPVNFRGAPIGSVTDIDLEVDERDLSVRIPVTIEIAEGTASWVTTNGDNKPRITPTELIDTLVKRGLRAQLALESFVTGKLYIQFDFRPEKPALYHGTRSGLPELPTVPSSLEQLTAKLEEIPLADILASLRKTMSAIEELVSSSDLTESMKAFNSFMKSAESLARKLDGQIDTASADVRATLTEVREVLEMMQQTFGATSPLGYEMLETLRSITQASKSIESFTRTLERQPDLLLKGRE